MLVELRVQNLLLIESAELRLGPGLNVITGETGAGKTVLAHALDLLLGGKPRSGIVRPGAEEAYVEGAFEVDGEEIVLGRRVSASGRSRAFLDGRTATIDDLRELGRRFVAFYGQHEHRKLTVASAQLEVLDAFCGAAQLAKRGEYAAAHARVRELRAELAELRGRAGNRERDLDLLVFEIGEIEALAPDEAEKTELLAGRDRLRHLEGLRAASGGGAEALVPETDAPGASTLLAEAERLAATVAGVDSKLDGLAERLQALRVEAEDLAGELRRS
jgi:DNA repair protein RecN (Recombination protein N)